MPNYSALSRFGGFILCALLVMSGTASAQVISNVLATSITNQSAVITWTTNLASSSIVNYGLTTGYGFSTAGNATPTTAHSVTLSGLAANTLYNFDVVSGAGSNSSLTSSNYRFATLSAAPIIGNINTLFVSSTTITINWTTDQPSSSLVNYGPTTNYGSSSPLSSTLSIAHTVNLTGLTPNTTYNFAVVSAGQSNVSSSSTNQMLTTSATPAAPNPGPVTISNISYSTGTISWTTDVPSTSAVAFGTTTALGQVTPIQAALTTSHQVTLTGLNRGTTYYFSCLSAGSSGTIGYTYPSNFFTVGPKSLVPVITNVATSVLSTTSVTIAWNTDAPSTSQVNYGTTASYGSSSPLNSTLTTSHSVTLNGLSANTLYDFQLVSASATGVSYFGANMAGITVWAWGDSLTAGGEDGTGSTYPLYLSTDLGVPVANEGVGGWTSTQVANLMLSTPAAFPTGNCNIFWAGRNNHFQVSQVLADNASMVNALALPACYLVVGEDNAPAEPIGSPDYQTITGTNATLASVYGNNFLDIREALVQDYNPALALDVSDHAEDVPPSSLRVVIPGGTVTSGALDSFSCTFSLSNATYGVGTVVIIDSETILLNTMSSTSTVTGCTRGYNSTAAATHAANAAYSTIDVVHLTSNGLEFVATQMAAWFQQKFPLNFTTSQSPGPVVSAVTVSSITGSTALISWTTNSASTSQVMFGATTNYGMMTTVNPTLTTSHSVLLSGLTPGTTYNFEVLSVTALGGSSISANSTFATAAPLPPVISGLGVIGLTATSATITWSTDQQATAQVNFGTTTGYGTLSAATSTLATSQSVTLTSLLPGTKYYFQAISGVTTATGSFTTTSGAVVIEPVISLIAASNVTTSTAVISWSTDQPSSSLVNYGTSTALGSTSTLSSTLVSTHSVTLTGLTPNTTYKYDVVSATTSASNTSSTYAFTTAPMSSSSATTGQPYVGYLASWGITNSGITLSWSTDVPADTEIIYGPAANNLPTATVISSSLTSSHGVVLSGLNSGTTYYYQCVSKAASGQIGSSTTYNFTTTGTPGSTPNIVGVTIGKVTGTSAVLTWTTDQPSGSQVNYGSTIAYGTSTTAVPTPVTSHSVLLSGLSPNTNYDFDVVSGPTTSGNYTFTTSGGAGGTPPVVSNVAFWGITQTGINISWSTDVPATTALAYGTTNSLGTTTVVQTPLAASHGITMSGLLPGTTYYFQAVSADASGDTGYSASTYSFTTLAGAPVISGIQLMPAKGNTATISWTTSAPAQSYVQFGANSGTYNHYSPLTGMTTNPICTLGYVPSGTVYYQLVSVDAYGNQTASAQMSFVEP